MDFSLKKYFSIWNDFCFLSAKFIKKVKEMKSKVLWIISSSVLVFVGCATGPSEEEIDAMIPPSANYSPIQAPVYPPLNQPYSPNLLNDSDSRVMNIDRLNVGEANIPSMPHQPTPPQNGANPQANGTIAPNGNGYYEPRDYVSDYAQEYVPSYIAPSEVVPYEQPLPPTQEIKPHFPAPMPQTAETPQKVEPKEPNIIPNSPLLAAENVIELSAVGMGVAPESTISPSQALALAKRAAIIDAYRQIGEKMYGIKINGQDTVKDMVMTNSVVKARVEALIKNADIVETIYKDGLCQVTMELKLDSKTWNRILSTNS